MHPAGLTSEEFVDAASRVIEELWHDDPGATFATATRMFADGISRHDIIHRLRRRTRADQGRIDRPEGNQRGFDEFVAVLSFYS